MAKLGYVQPDKTKVYVDTAEIAAIRSKPGGKGAVLVLKSGYEVVVANDSATTAQTDWNGGVALADAAGNQ